MHASLHPSPLHFSAPENVLPLSLHLDRHDGLLGLLDGIHLGGDGAELVELMETRTPPEINPTHYTLYVHRYIDRPKDI